MKSYQYIEEGKLYKFKSTVYHEYTPSIVRTVKRTGKNNPIQRSSNGKKERKLTNGNSKLKSTTTTKLDYLPKPICQRGLDGRVICRSQVDETMTRRTTSGNNKPSLTTISGCASMKLKTTPGCAKSSSITASRSTSLKTPLRSANISLKTTSNSANSFLTASGKVDSFLTTTWGIAEVKRIAVVESSSTVTRRSSWILPSTWDEVSMRRRRRNESLDNSFDQDMPTDQKSTDHDHDLSTDHNTSF